jgi:hypothetical protein
MRKRREMRLQARATTGEVRMSALVLGVIPIFIIAGLVLVTPTYLLPLVEDPRGNVIIAVAVVSMLTGFGVIRWMMLSVTRSGSLLHTDASTHEVSLPKVIAHPVGASFSPSINRPPHRLRGAATADKLRHDGYTAPSRTRPVWPSPA